MISAVKIVSLIDRISEEEEKRDFGDTFEAELLIGIMGDLHEMGMLELTVATEIVDYLNLLERFHLHLRSSDSIWACFSAPPRPHCRGAAADRRVHQFLSLLSLSVFSEL